MPHTSAHGTMYIDKPCTAANLKEMEDAEGSISVRVGVDFEDVLFGAPDGFFDTVSEKITGSICGLTDITYKVIDGSIFGDEVIVEITGFVDYSSL